MQPTLLLVGVFPPPAAGADIFAEFYGSCTRLAANTRKTFIMKNIIRYAFLLYVFLHLVFGPVYQRVYFNEFIHFVPLHQLHVTAGGRIPGDLYQLGDLVPLHCPVLEPSDGAAPTARTSMWIRWKTSSRSCSSRPRFGPCVRSSRTW